VLVLAGFRHITLPDELDPENHGESRRFTENIRE